MNAKEKKVGWGEGWTHGSQPREEKLGAIGRAFLTQRVPRRRITGKREIPIPRNLIKRILTACSILEPKPKHLPQPPPKKGGKFQNPS